MNDEASKEELRAQISKLVKAYNETPTSTMKRFRTNRLVDATGANNLGYIAEGVIFSDGSVIIRWLKDGSGTGLEALSFYNSIKNLEATHGLTEKIVVELID